MEKLYLGTGVADITPPIGGQLYGYAPDVFSCALEDRLNATAFYFAQGDVRALMISATVCLVNTALDRRIRSALAENTGIPAGNILLHATHTHSGPNTAGSYGWGDMDTEYCEGIFIPAVLAAAAEAMAAPVPVVAGVAEGESLVGINRRELTAANRITLGQNPWGPMDRRMTVVSFRDMEGKCVANIIHYGCHGTAAGRNREINRDWSGIMCDTLSRESGGVTAFFNGPEGDVGPRITNGKTVGEDKSIVGNDRGDIRYVRQLGQIAARDAVGIWRRIWDWHPVRLRAGSTRLPIAVKTKMPEETARELLKGYEGKTVNLQGQIRRHLEMVLAAHAAGEPDAEARDVPLAVLALGNLVFAGVPYETFSEIGLRVDGMVAHARVLSLSNTNGSEGYFVTEDALCRGGYEVEMFRYGEVQPFVDHADYELVRRSADEIEKMISEDE